MWRWSYLTAYKGLWATVFSTYVEMILFCWSPTMIVLCILHVCGDDPNPISKYPEAHKYSPRMWRWSLQIKWTLWLLFVFSTYVEMIPPTHFVLDPIQGILHVCGDDPSNHYFLGLCTRYSPRMWRWSLVEIAINLNKNVFSTYVEMILVAKWTPTRIICILHVCGDDPNSQVNQSINQVYSPRMWRWSSLKERQLC